jgi:hypothetical protein
MNPRRAVVRQAMGSLSVASETPSSQAAGKGSACGHAVRHLRALTAVFMSIGPWTPSHSERTIPPRPGRDRRERLAHRAVEGHGGDEGGVLAAVSGHAPVSPLPFGSPRPQPRHGGVGAALLVHPHEHLRVHFPRPPAEGLPLALVALGGA